MHWNQSAALPVSDGSSSEEVQGPRHCQRLPPTAESNRNWALAIHVLLHIITS